MFGLDSKAGRILKRVYSNPVQDLSQSMSRLRTPTSSQRMRKPQSRGCATHTAGFLSGTKEEDFGDLSAGSITGSSMQIA